MSKNYGQIPDVSRQDDRAESTYRMRQSARSRSRSTVRDGKDQLAIETVGQLGGDGNDRLAYKIPAPLITM